MSGVEEALDRHYLRVHGPKRCGWGCQFIFPEVDCRRYNKHISRYHAGQVFREGIVIGKRPFNPRVQGRGFSSFTRGRASVKRGTATATQGRVLPSIKDVKEKVYDRNIGGETGQSSQYS